jgi:hypothetical protein
LFDNSPFYRHGRTCSGHPRLSFGVCEDVDARNKCGHDDFGERWRIEEPVMMAEKFKPDSRATSPAMTGNQ